MGECISYTRNPSSFKASIMIEVRLFATFRYGREKTQYLDSEKFLTGIDILNHLEISSNEVAIFLINGRHSKATDSIKDNDIIAIFPPVGGG